MKYDKKTNFFDLRRMAVKVGKKLGENAYDGKISNCSAQVQVHYNFNTEKLGMVRFRCKNRFCPICNHVKSSTLATYINSQYDALEADYHIISLTLTVRNVSLYDLKNTQKAMFTAFRKAQQVWRYSLPEYAGLRTYEVTYSHTLKNYHPHFHSLLLFPKSVPLEKLSTFDFGGLFARYLPDELTAYGISPKCFGSHNANNDKLNTSYHKSVTWECKPYDPSKSTLFEFTKYMSKFSQLVNELSDEDFQYYYDISANVPVHSMYGAWRGYLKHMPTDLDESIFWDSTSTIQNANCVYVGVVSTPALFINKNIPICFSNTFSFSDFQLASPTSYGGIEVLKIFISENLLGKGGITLV